MSSISQNTESEPVRLRITEIFYSLQGEANTVGIPTVFIRLTGCPLRCQYCDTSYAFTGGEWWTLPQIMAKLEEFSCRHVCVTGGEPLAQKACRILLNRLCDDGYEVSLETSGAMDICDVDNRVSRVMDIKTPASGEEEKNRWENLDCLTAHDQIKFVICNRDDYLWAKQILLEKKLVGRCEIFFSPSHSEIRPVQLAEWLLEDHLDVRFQMQLHKLLWNDEPGH